MPVRVYVRVTPIKFDQVQKAVDNLAERIRNPDDKLMRRMIDASVEDVDRRFATRGYNTWPPLSPRTIKRKGNDEVLVETGTMRVSVFYRYVAKGIFQIFVPFGGTLRAFYGVDHRICFFL